MYNIVYVFIIGASGYARKCPIGLTGQARLWEVLSSPARPVPLGGTGRYHIP